MKATTVIVMLVVMGLLFELDVVPGVGTLGGAILDAVLPADLGGGADWSGLVAITAGVLSIGVVLLGQKVPYAVFFTLFIGFMFMPIDLLVNPAIGMPNTVRVLFGIVWLGMFVSAAVSMFRSDA